MLLETSSLRVGEFVCAPGDPAWDEVNTNMGAWSHVVFPRTQVLIAQEGARSVLVSPNHVVYYRPHQRYRRGLRDPRGDRCVWIEFAPSLVELPDAPAGPCDARTYLLAVALARHAGEDRLLGEEAALALLERALRSRGGGPAPRRARTRGEHADLAEAAKELLAAEPHSLAEVAAALYVSPFHLARVFRARTGFSIAGYVNGLRLRRAVERLAAEPGVDLSRLALELGYCSQSHFTDRFRAAFGAPPSALRGVQLSTIVEARLPSAA
jgi:AraC family transcriptional regulator